MDFAQGTRFLGVLALVAGAGAVALLVAPRHQALAPLRAHAAWAAGLVATVATAGSLWLSEGIGLEPCTLCWAQRGAMYPLVLLLPALALRPSRPLRLAVTALAGVGLLLSSWHVLLQRVPALAETTSCSATAPCSAALVEVFGVLTIPTMAGLGFLAVLALVRPTRSPA